MDRETDLSEIEMPLIIRKTAKCILIEAIAKQLGRHQGTRKTFLMDSSPRKKRSDGQLSKIKADRNLCRIRRAMSANSGKYSGEIFDAVGLKNVPKSTSNKVLRGMGKNISPIKWPPIISNTAKREYNGPNST